MYYTDSAAQTTAHVVEKVMSVATLSHIHITAGFGVVWGGGASAVYKPQRRHTHAYGTTPRRTRSLKGLDTSTLLQYALSTIPPARGPEALKLRTRISHRNLGSVCRTYGELLSQGLLLRVGVCTVTCHVPAFI